jgi:ABC-type antimicrobial peptide transport system permease subunit
MHLAVALGVASATAVLTGALLVGDSVRGSLRHLTLDRLGRIDELLVADRFFGHKLVQELTEDPAARRSGWQALPAILVPSATAETSGGQMRRRAAGITIVGCTGQFWDWGRAAARPAKIPRGNEVVLNAPLADELDAKVGDTIVLRLAKVAQIPADSALGRKTDRITSLAGLKVAAIVPAESLGRFSLQAAQTAPRNAYVPLELLQEALDVGGQINCILAARDAGRSEESASRALRAALKPELADYGISVTDVRIRFGEGEDERVITRYFSITSDRMIFDEATAAAVKTALAAHHPQPVLTYLANEIRKVPPKTGDSANGEASAPPVDSRPSAGSKKGSVPRSASTGIPYSTITAIDPAPGGPLVDDDGNVLPPLADGEIVLNRWAAEDQGAKVGDTIRVTWFEPETTHGQEQEASAEFRLKAIVPLTEPAEPFGRRRPAQFDMPPTPANDPHLTPEVKGITDQASIADWDAPFEFHYDRIRPQDDAYWENHRTTPKAFVSLATGQRLWGSRFGNVTGFRVPAAVSAGFGLQGSGGEAGGRQSEPVGPAAGRQPPPLTVEASTAIDAAQISQLLKAELRKHHAELGFAFRPIKQEGIASSQGTTPFDVLFLLLSLFIIAAALMLVWLLFRLGVEQRAVEIGLLGSLGWPTRKTAGVLLAEGGVVAAAGGLIGVVGGVGYAWLMLAGLRTWWVGAIATPFLQLHMTPTSLAIGYALGVLVSQGTIWLSLRLLSRVPAKGLLLGQTQVEWGAGKRRSGGYSSWIAAALFVAAGGMAVLATTLGGEAQAGAFLGAGGAVLAAMLLVIAARLRWSVWRGISKSLVGLAAKNASRNPGRSVATIALMASASFLIVAVSAFRLDPTDEGIGGFDLMAESAEPIYHDLNSEAGRRQLLADKSPALDGAMVLAFRVKPGDDASCRNLYQPSQPRILGVTPAMIRYFDDPKVSPRFAFAASAAETAEEQANPWRVLLRGQDASLLREQAGGTSALPDAVPVILDKNTAMYSLKLYFGIGQEFSVTYADGQTVRFRVAGLLSNSILQGCLLVGEADFNRLFPRVSGYRSFLIKSPPGKSDAVAAALEDRLGDEGFDASDSRERLADLLAVQNTYISTFQSLGALGLVLGTFGLAAVQLRNVLERRKELALMRAVGFRGGRLGEMVLLENLLLLLAGLACGTIAALFSAVPNMVFGGAQVPLADLAVMLGVVVTVGMATGLIAVRATLRAPILGALRGN